MKKIVVSGYYGYDNVGDEALLKAIVDALRTFDAQLHITVLSAQPDKTSVRLGVHAVSRTNPKEIIAVIKECDLLISGGGSLLQDVTGPLTIPYYLGIVMIAKALNKPVMFYAQGVGPVNKQLGRSLIKQVVNRVDLITLRDNESAQLLQEIGVKRPPVRITADPVFGIHNSQTGDAKDELLAKLKIDQAKGPLVGMAIRSWPNSDQAFKSLIEAAEYLADQGRQVILIPMHFRQDLSIARQLQKEIKRPVLVLEENHSPDILLQLIGSLEMIIAMRLHALIFGAVSGVPVLGISYDPKVDQFLQTPGCISAGRVEAIDKAVLIGHINHILKNREAISGQLIQQCSQLREAALDNARLAIDLLNKKGTKVLG